MFLCPGTRLHPINGANPRLPHHNGGIPRGRLSQNEQGARTVVAGGKGKTLAPSRKSAVPIFFGGRGVVAEVVPALSALKVLRGLLPFTFSWALVKGVRWVSFLTFRGAWVKS